MGDNNVIVPLVFEEMADEENLFPVLRTTSWFPGVCRPIDDSQRKILDGIILSRAERLHCSPALLRMSFLDAYRIEDLKDLPGHLFNDALRRLVKFRGVQ